MVVVLANKHRWTIDEFEGLHAKGALPNSGRCELIEGDIVEMPAMKTPHGSGMTCGTNLLARLFGNTHAVRVQCPFNIPEYSQPEPDFLLLPKQAYRMDAHPTTADLIVEVSDSSLEYDRTTKAGLYAMAGVQDYWILDVAKPGVLVHRDPGLIPGQPFGYAYRKVKRYGLRSSVAPLFRPEVKVPVKSFFHLD